MQVNNYRLFLYRPQAANIAITGSYPTEYNNQFLGELKVFDLKLDLKLQDISTITFKVPENIGTTINSRLFQVLEFFVVELWYGNLEGTVDVDYFRYRFIINKNPLSYSDGQKSYEYSGSSLEYSLEFKNIFNWPGILIRDFYRSIVYTSGTPSTFTEVAAVGVTLTPYSILESTNTIKTKYITVPTTTADEENIDPPSTFDIFIYQHKRNSDDSVNSENSIIEYSGSVSDENFKNGFYIPVLNEDGKVIAINIAIPNDITNFDAADKFFELRLYDNPVSRHFAVGINTDQEIKASDMYLDLAHSDKTVFNVSLKAFDYTSYRLFVAKSSPNVNKLYPGQELKDESTISIYPTGTKILEIDRTTDLNFVYITVSDLPNNLADISTFKSFKVISKNIEYLDYTFSVQTVYSKNGLKLEHILLGTQETRDEDDEIQNSKLTIEGLIYDTDFTIGEIHPIIAAKYRSNIELNNITKYQAIKDIAETFDSIPVFDSIKRTVSFYPDKNEDAFTNNGLIITERNYLKNLNNNIDSTKIVTKGYGIGKDNMGIELITPNGDGAWEDYSYFLDTYYVEFDKDNILEDMSFNSTNGLTFSSFPEGGLSRWMTSTEALALSKWQYRRDYFHNVMLGELDPLITEHEKYYNLYNLRSESINNFVKEESKYYEIKAVEYNYKFLYEKYVNQNSNLTDEQRRNKTFLYNYSNTTTEANPGLGIFRLNSNNFETVTKIIINNKDSNDIFRTTFLTTLNAQNNPRIILTEKTDLENGLPTNFISYNVKGRVTFTDYVVIDVVFISKTQSGSIFANNDQVYLQFKTWEEIYKEKYDAAVVNSAISLSNINQLHYKIYNNRIDGTIAKPGDEDFAALSTISQSSFATLILEVQSFLNKENNNIDLNSLKPFIREAVMNDSKIDNELDLIIALQEFVLEHSKPTVTLDIGVADFLGSEDLRQFWNKVKIGEVVNIYFKDFNVDTTAQLREISIDFQSNTLNFVISTYRHYGRAPLNWMLRQIRYVHNDQYNKYTYYNDKNNDTSNNSDDLKKIIQPGGSGFNAGDTGFNFGSQKPEGEEEEKPGDYSGEIGPEGIVVYEVEIDPILEVFSLVKDKKIQIANGSLIASSYVETDNPFTSEVEVSGDNGFVIRKKQIVNEELSVTKQMYIDTDGNAVFSGFLSVNQQEEQIGYSKEGVFAGKENEVSKFSLKSEDTFLLFDPDATDYKLKISGSAQIGPLTIASADDALVAFSNTPPLPRIDTLPITDDIRTETFNFATASSNVERIVIETRLRQFGEGKINNRAVKIELFENLDADGTKHYEETISYSIIYGSGTRNEIYIFSNSLFLNKTIRSLRVSFPTTGLPPEDYNILIGDTINPLPEDFADLFVIKVPVVTNALSKIELGNFKAEASGDVKMTNAEINTIKLKDVSTTRFLNITATNTSGADRSIILNGNNINQNITYTLPNSTGTLVLNPMTAFGDIIYGGTVSNTIATPTRLAAGPANSVLTSNGTGTAPSWTSLGTGITSRFAVTNTTYVTAMSSSLPIGTYIITFNGAWYRTFVTFPTTFRLNAIFEHNARARITGSGFYATSENATTFTNFYLNHNSNTDNVAGSGFTTTSETTTRANVRIWFSAFITVTTATTLRIRLQTSGDTSTGTGDLGLEAGSGFTLTKVA